MLPERNHKARLYLGYYINITTVDIERYETFLTDTSDSYVYIVFIKK